MKVIHTDVLKLGTKMSSDEELWIYNGLDCCVTREILDVLLPQLDNMTSSTYTLSRNLQGPVLEMNMRGVRIDEEERKRMELAAASTAAPLARRALELAAEEEAELTSLQFPKLSK